MRDGFEQERLERRLVLNATLVGGVLTLSGTRADNRLIVQESDDQIIATSLGRSSQAFDRGAVTSILVNGVAGNDSIVVRLQSNIPTTVNAGSGDDSVVIQASFGITALGEGGNDSFNTSDPLGIFGTYVAGGNTLFGGGGDDSFFDRSDDEPMGADSIEAGDGNDDIRGLIGNDTIFCGPGDDIVGVIDGSPVSRDLIYGEDGNDTINAAAGDDTIFGGAGRDVIFGSAGKDSIRGGAQGDFIDGGRTNDTVNGDSGNDTILGGDNVDRLTGSSGSDTFSAAERVADEVLDFNGTEDVTV